MLGNCHTGLTDTKIVPHHEFQAACLTEDFQTRFGFLAPPSQLFQVRFLRASWHIARDGWYIGSYQVPPIGRAVILTVRYMHDGAVYGVATVPDMLDCRQVRQIFSVTHGTFIRCNGCFASGWIHFSHGDVLEFHAATVHAGIPISLDSCQGSIMSGSPASRSFSAIRRRPGCKFSDL